MIAKARHEHVNDAHHVIEQACPIDARGGLAAGLLEEAAGARAGNGVDLDHDGDTVALGVLLAFSVDHRRPDLIVDLGRNARAPSIERNIGPGPSGPP